MLSRIVCCTSVGNKYTFETSYDVKLLEDEARSGFKRIQWTDPPVKVENLIMPRGWTL